MSVSWIAFGDLDNSTGVAEFSLVGGGGGVRRRIVGAPPTFYRVGRWFDWEGFIYQVDLGPFANGDEPFRYRVGVAASPTSAAEFSSWFVATSLPQSPRPSTIAIVADKGVFPGGGVFSGETNAALIRNLDRYEMLLNVGDLTYAYGFQSIWDDCGRKMEPITSTRPYLVACGNHDSRFNFTVYRHRFFMPNTSAAGWANAPFWYGVDHGLAHIVVLSTQHPLTAGSPQHQWLAAELAAADRQRQLRPWIVVMFHKPMYCSNTETSCGGWAAALRRDIEPLLGPVADIVVFGHVHAAQATRPLFNCTVQGSLQDPRGPVYLLVGNGGAIRGGHDSPFHPQPWSLASNSRDFGFALLDLQNHTTAHISYLKATDSSVLFDFHLTKRLK